MDIESLLFDLSVSDCMLPGEEGHRKALNELRKLCPEACSDNLGNIIAPVFPTPAGGEHILIDAHLDEIGFVVTTIDPDGFLRVNKVGGPDMRTLLGHEVTVHGKKTLYGVFCCQPPHLTSRADYKKAAEISEIAIDVGLSHDKACELVSPGDTVFLRRNPAKMLGGLVTGKAFDNRAGVVSILRCIDLLKGQKPGAGLSVIFSLSEETSFKAVSGGTFAVAPTQAIVIDVSFALTPDSPKEKCGEFFKGPMIGISPVLSRPISDRLIELARKADLPSQREIMAGDTGTNSDAVSITGAGIKTGLVSIPLRYMHTAAEVIAPQDIESTARLLARYVLSPIETNAH